MNTFTPLWSKTLDSTLWEESKDVRIMFFTMLMARDPDHVVRMPLRVLAKKANLDPDKERAYDLAEAAIAVLEREDRRSRENQEFGGRRIERLSGGQEGWLVLNGQKYQDEMITLWRRMVKTRKQRERREKLRKGTPLAGEAAFVKAVEAGDEGEADRIAAEGLPSGAAVTPDVEEFRRKMAAALQQVSTSVLEQTGLPAADAVAAAGLPSETFPEV